MGVRVRVTRDVHVFTPSDENTGACTFSRINTIVVSSLRTCRSCTLNTPNIQVYPPSLPMLLCAYALRTDRYASQPCGCITSHVHPAGWIGLACMSITSYCLYCGAHLTHVHAYIYHPVLLSIGMFYHLTCEAQATARLLGRTTDRGLSPD